MTVIQSTDFCIYNDTQLDFFISVTNLTSIDNPYLQSNTTNVHEFSSSHTTPEDNYIESLWINTANHSLVISHQLWNTIIPPLLLRLIAYVSRLDGGSGAREPSKGSLWNSPRHTASCSEDEKVTQRKVPLLFRRGTRPFPLRSDIDSTRAKHFVLLHSGHFFSGFGKPLLVLYS